MELAQRYAVLVARRLAVEEGIEMLMRTQLELRADTASAKGWGNTAVLLNAILIPANCIINAFSLGAAKSAYQVAARALYEAVGASGKRGSKTTSVVLKALKDAIVAELKRKGMAQYVPGVSILVGLAQDSLALLETSATVAAGEREFRSIAAALDRKIEASKRQLTGIGVQLSEVIDQAQAIGRTG